VGSAQAQGMDANPLHKAQNRDKHSCMQKCRSVQMFNCYYIQTN